MLDDQELLRRYVEDGEEAAFTALVERHVAMVYAVSRRKTGGDSHLAREATQQVFTALARKADALRQHVALTGWLFTSARYAAAQLVRTERRRRFHERKAQTMNDLLREDSSAAIDWDRLRPQLDDLIGELGERDREVVLLRFFEGRAYDEIGQRLRLSEEGARSRLERALEKLRRALARRGVTSTGAALAAALSSQAGLAAPAGLAAAISGAALAAGATAAGFGTAASFFAIMSTTKITVSIGALAVAVAIGFGLRERRRAHEAWAERAVAVSERATLQARVRALEARAVTAPAPMRAVSTPSPPAAPTRAPAGGDQDAIPDEALDRFVATNPELQKLYLRQHTLRTASHYGPFYHAAKLTPSQIAGFEKAMVAYDQALIDIATAAVEQGLDKNSPQLAHLREAAREERNRAMREALGADVFGMFAEYQKTRTMRDVANDVAREVFYTSTPLTAAQADALTHVVAQARRDGKGVETWDLIVARTQEAKILSPEQLAVLAVRREQIKLGEEIHAALAPLRAAIKSAAPSR